MRSLFRPTFSLFAVALLAVAPVRFARAQTSGPAQPGRTLDGIAAVVGNNVILNSEVEQQTQVLLEQQRQQSGRAPSPSVVRREVLQSRIDEQVMAAHARRDTTLSVSDAEIEQYLDQRISRLSQQAGGRSRLEEAYGKSVTELKADFEDQVRNQLLAQRFQQRRLAEVRITPTEVREWYAQFPQDSLPTLPTAVELSHIVRRPEATASAQRQAREVIGAIRDSALAGVSIEDLARRYSDDAGSASQGGRLEQSTNELVPSFAAVVSRAPIGEISQVFETSFGYHIVRVNERSGNTADFNHVLIEVDKSTSTGQEARDFLTAVRDSIIDQGVPFGVMARRYSEEEQSASQGGRVTVPQSGQSTLRLDALGSSWQSTLDTLDAGEVSRPAEVRLIGPEGERAFHIVELNERIEQHRLNLDQDYARIKQRALQEKQARVYQRWVRKLREDVYVDVRSDALAASAES